MEEIIAVRSKKPLINITMYFVASIILLIIGLVISKPIWIVGCILALISVGVLIYYLSVPKIIIKKLNSNTYQILKNKVLAHQILNVTYRKSRKNGGQFEYGEVMIKLPNKYITLMYVESCEAVADKLLQK